MTWHSDNWTGELDHGTYPLGYQINTARDRLIAVLAIGSTELRARAIVDALEGAFKPSPVTGRQTLNDTVTHAWVDGKVLYSDGALDRKAVILAQIHLLWSGK